MGATRNQAAALAAAIGMVACHSESDARDLRKNPDLYRDTGYEVRAAVDRTAFVAPLVEAREPIAEASGPYPTHWQGDDVWSRPPVAMIEDIVIDELRASGIFTEVVEGVPGPETLIVTPYLVRLRHGAEERIAGRRTVAEVGLRVVVHGPGGATEDRPVLFDRSFEEVAATEVGMRPPPSAQLVGVALRKAVAKMLGALDQSNVSRSNVPIDLSVSGR